jgi:hypothetical protein
MTTIAEGISFILGHFNEPNFPRHIFTPVMKQIKVANISEVYRYFEEANFKDIRISAYPYREEYEILLYGAQAPDLLFVDLDRSQFKSTLALNRVLHKTQKILKTNFIVMRSFLYWSQDPVAIM